MTEPVLDKATPAMRQWREMKDRHPDKIIFFRMGDFYETFYEDAVTISRLVGLTLTRRGKSADAPPLAGVPHHQKDRYVRELLLKGVSVAVADQLEDPTLAKGVVKRGITEVFTPGTLIDDNVLPAVDNNYLAAVTSRGGVNAVAFADLSTGEFIVSLPSDEALEDDLARRRPAETLAARDALSDPESPVARVLALGLGGGLSRRDPYDFDPAEGAARLQRRLGVATLAAFDVAEHPAALGAVGAILGYLEENQAAGLGHLRPPRLADDSGVLIIDRHTIRNLELVPDRPGDKSGVLLGVLDRTLTGPGARLLRSRLLAPSSRLDVIRPRQEAVGELMRDDGRRGELRRLLDRMADLERIAARIATRRAGPRDLAALAAACRRLPEMAEFASGAAAPLLRAAADLDPLQDAADLVEDALVPAPPLLASDGGVIRPGFHPEVDELRDIMTGGREWLEAYQAREQEKSGIPSLKVNYNRVHGYYIEITHTHRDRIPAGYERKQTLVNAERYTTPELREHERKVLGAEGNLKKLEMELFQALREEVAGSVRRIQAAAAMTAELDFLASLAEAGADGGYTVPEMHEGLETRIEGSRHPVVERLLPAGEFVDNDIEFSADNQRILIITGPNMAGKSTYIRQAALLVVMAHLGSPIPARSAVIGLADRVFSRVGASDDLARGQSTFMVEMLETAEILNNATERSLLILDEVGRGTSTFDGVSLAWAITEYLHHSVRARTLFATHYHELAELGHLLPAAKNFNVAVREWNNDITFLRRVVPGACDRSYGIQVGRMAGIPKAVVKRAGEILKGLEVQAQERDWKMLEDSREILRAAAREVQLELFAPPRRTEEVARELMLELSRVDVNRLSPIDAHALLSRLADKTRGG